MATIVVRVVTAQASRAINGLIVDFKRLDTVSGTALGSMTKSVGVAATSMAALTAAFVAFESITAAAKSFATINTELEVMNQLLVGATGSVEGAAAAFDELIEYSKEAPFSIDALTDAFVKLKVSGIDDVMGSVDAYSNAVAAFGGSSEQLKLVILGLQQALSKGTASSEEFRRQIAEQIPGAMQGMAAELDMTYQEMTDTMKKGTLSSKDAVDALTRYVAKFAGSNARVMDTMRGAVTRLKTEWSVLMKELGDSGVWDSLKNGVKAVADELSNLRESGDLTELFAGITRSVEETVNYLIDNKETVVSFFELFVQGAKLAIEAIGLLTKTIVIFSNANDVDTNLTGITGWFDKVQAAFANSLDPTKIVTGYGEAVDAVQELIDTYNSVPDMGYNYNGELVLMADDADTATTAIDNLNASLAAYIEDLSQNGALYKNIIDQSDLKTDVYDTGKTYGAAAPSTEDIAKRKAAQAAYNKQLAAAEKQAVAVDKALDDMFEQEIEDAVDQLEDYNQALKDINDETASNQLSTHIELIRSSAGEYAALTEEIKTSALERKKALSEEGQLTNETSAAVDALAQSQYDLAEASGEVQEALIADAKAGDSFVDGFTAGILDMQDSLYTLGQIGYEVADELRDALGSTLSSALKGDWDEIADIWDDFLDSMIDKAANYFVDQAFEIGTNFVSELISGAESADTGLLSSLSKLVEGDFSGAFSSLFGGGSDCVTLCDGGVLGEASSALGEAAGSLASTATELASSSTSLVTAGASIAALSDVVDGFSLSSSSDAYGTYGDLTTAYASDWSAATDSMVESFSTASTSAWSTIATTADSYWNTAASTAGEAFYDSASLVSEQAQFAYADIWSEMQLSTGTEATSMWASAKTGVSEFVADIKTGAENLVGGAENLSTITSGIGTVAGAYSVYSGISDMMENGVSVGNSVQTGLGAYSLYENLPVVYEGITSAITSAAPALESAITSAAPAIESAVTVGAEALASETLSIVASETVAGVSTSASAGVTASSTGASAGMSASAGFGAVTALPAVAYFFSNINDIFNMGTEMVTGTVTSAFSDASIEITAMAGSIETATNMLNDPAWVEAQVNAVAEYGTNVITDMGAVMSDAYTGYTDTVSGIMGASMEDLDEMSAGTEYGSERAGAISESIDTLPQKLDEAYEAIVIQSETYGDALSTLALTMGDSTGAFDTYVDTIAGYDVALADSTSMMQLASEAAGGNASSYYSLTEALQGIGLTAEEAASEASTMMAVLGTSVTSMASEASAAAATISNTSFDMSASAVIDVSVIGDARADAIADANAAIEGYASGGVVGGMLQGGSGIADDLYLGKVNGQAIVAQGGEFIMNPKASSKYRNVLEQMNASTFAGGGFTTRPTRADPWYDHTKGAQSDVADSDAMDTITKLVEKFNDTIADMNLSDYLNDIRDVNAEYDEYIETLNESGAATEDIKKAEYARWLELEEIEKKRAESVQNLMDSYKSGTDDSLAAKLKDVNDTYADTIDKAVDVGATQAEINKLTEEYNKHLDETKKQYAETVMNFMRPFNDLVSGISDTEKEIRKLNESYDDSIERAKELGLSQQQLTVIEEARIIALTNMTDDIMSGIQDTIDKDAMSATEYAAKGINDTYDEMHDSLIALNATQEQLAKLEEARQIELKEAGKDSLDSYYSDLIDMGAKVSTFGAYNVPNKEYKEPVVVVNAVLQGDSLINDQELSTKVVGISDNNEYEKNRRGYTGRTVGAGNPL